MNISEYLSKRLKSYREEKKLSQSAYAQELGVAKATLQKLEEERSVSSQTLQHVVDQIGMELSIRPREPRKEGVTVSALIEEFLEGLSDCAISDSKRKGVETALRGIEALLEEKD